MTKIFGERLLLRETPKEEKLQQGVFIPESTKRGYAFCEVVEIGNGVLDRSQRQPPPDLAKGDIVFVQINPQMAASSGHIIDDKRHYMCHWHDALAVITGIPPTLETFRPVGRWVLAKLEIEEQVGLIIIPNQNVQNAAGKVKFTIAKMGVLAQDQLGLAEGDSVLIDKARANVFSLGKTRMVYVDAEYVTAKL
mgnify:CR=1 FL=1